MNFSSRSLRWSSLVVLALFGAGCASSAPVAPPMRAVPVSPPIETAPATTTLDVTATTTAEVEAPLPVAALLDQVKGNVQVTRDGMTAAGADQFPLEQGDVVNVSATGSAVIVWPAYGRTTLSGGSRVELKVATTTSDTNTIGVRMNLEAGNIWTRLERLLGADSSFGVRAGDTVATVRGTSFGVKRNGKKVHVSVMVSHVSVARVKDEPLASPSMAAQDVTSTEVVVGTAALLGPQDEMQDDQAKKALAVVKKMTKLELRDPLLVMGNATTTAEEMRMRPLMLRDDLRKARVFKAIEALETPVTRQTVPEQATALRDRLARIKAEGLKSTQEQVGTTPQPTSQTQTQPTEQTAPAPESQPQPTPDPTPAPAPTPSPAPAPAGDTTSSMIEQGLNHSGTEGTTNW